MKKLFYGLGAVAAVVTPVVAVVSCGTKTVKKTNVSGPMARTADLIFRDTVQKVVDFEKESELKPQDQQPFAVVIQLGILDNISNDWVLRRVNDGKNNWNNSFRKMALDIFEMSGGIEDNADAVNLTSWTNAELKDFLVKNFAGQPIDLDQAKGDLADYGLVSKEDKDNGKLDDINFVNEQFSKLKAMTDDELKAAYISAGFYDDTTDVKDARATLTKDLNALINPNATQIEIDPLHWKTKMIGGKDAETIVREHSTLPLDQWIPKFTSLFNWASQKYAGGNANVFSAGDLIKVSNRGDDEAFDHIDLGGGRGHADRPKDQYVIQTFDFK